MIDPDLTADALPASVAELVEVIGLPAALKIVEARGGIRLCVPKQARADHWLAELIGTEALTRLVEMYAGEEIDVPRCAAALHAMKAREIHAKATEGASNAVLARLYGYTERGIRKLRRRMESKANDPQQDLF